ncbi:MAG: hypothetical protein ACXADH_00455 [Candidatus Kariarchaeaceae archaeon]|jgi:hypothetical protein
MLVHHHLGLGDHIICNGLVRKLFAQPSDVTLVVKNKNLINVKRMFKDIDIVYKSVENDVNIQGTLGWCFGGDRSIDFDQSFYKQAGVSFSERWDSFYIERDYKQEKVISDYLNLPSRFALVNDEASAGKANVNIQTDLPKVHLRKLPVEKSIFDWMEVIERATEIHCINSSFIHLVDSMAPMAKLFYYNDRPQLPFTRRLEWILCQ